MNLMPDDTPMSVLKSDQERDAETPWERRAWCWSWNALHPQVLARRIDKLNADWQTKVDVLTERIETLEGQLDKAADVVLCKNARIRALRLRVREAEGDAPALAAVKCVVEDAGRAVRGDASPSAEVRTADELPRNETVKPEIGATFAATLARRRAEAMKEPEIAARIVKLAGADPGWNEHERLRQYERTATRLAGSGDLADEDHHVGARWLRMEPKRRSAALGDLRERKVATA